MSTPGIEGKVALVTGGARGIGRAYALGLGRAGASVVVADVLDDDAATTLALLDGEGVKASFVHTDVADETSTQNMVDEVVRQFGGLDILVNNAALYGGLRYGSFMDITVEMWDRVYAINVKGVWLCTKAAAPAMRMRGGGIVVNQSSTGAYTAGPGLAHYTSTKSAVVGLTKTFAKELADWNIRVNCIAPGAIHTQASIDLGGSQETMDSIVAAQLVKRPGREEDMVGPLLFLCSDASSFVTGQVMIADGGRILLG